MKASEQDSAITLNDNTSLAKTVARSQPQRTTSSAQVIEPSIPLSVADRLLFISDKAMKNGVHLVAGPGSGKSRLLGRILAWQLLLRNQSQLILDPTGGIVDNLCDKIRRLPLDYRRKLWPQLHYVDAGAIDFIVPTPLYYRVRQADTLFEIANRFLGLLKRQDPQLESAPILGWNALYECGLYAGQIAAACNEQIDFAADLVMHPKQHKERLREILAMRPNLLPAITYFRELMDPNNAELRTRRTSSFLNKLIPLLSDPSMLAAVATQRPGVDWEAMVNQRKTVIIDLRNERDPDRRRFKLLYWFRHFIDFVKHRGMAGRGHEVTFMIDEITQLLGHRTLSGQSVLAEDLEELIAVLGRNFGINVAIGHQNLNQIDERTRNVLMQMGTQIIGVLSNPDDARFIARQFLHYDPYLVKKREPVWMSDVTEFRVVDHTTVEFSADEQLLLMANRFQQLERFRFLVRPAKEEGGISGELKRLSIANLDRNQYPDEEEIAPIRRMLAQRDGIPVEELLAEVRGRRQEEVVQNPAKRSHSSAILKSKLDETDDSAPECNTDDPDSGSDDLRASTPATAVERAEHDEFWQ